MDDKKTAQFTLVYILISLALLFLSACGSSNDTGDNQPVEENSRIQVASGEKVYRQNCASCHSTSPNTVIVGPSLAGIGTSAETRIKGMGAREYLLVAITEPDKLVIEGYDDIMPKNFGQALSEEDGRQLPGGQQGRPPHRQQRNTRPWDGYYR